MQIYFAKKVCTEHHFTFPMLDCCLTYINTCLLFKLSLFCWQLSDFFFRLISNLPDSKRKVFWEFRINEISCEKVSFILLRWKGEDSHGWVCFLSADLVKVTTTDKRTDACSRPLCIYTQIPLKFQPIKKHKIMKKKILTFILCNFSVRTL